MKKIFMLLVAAVGLFFCSDIKGQTAFGIKGGVNIANMTDNTHKPRVSGHGGLFVNRTFNKYFAVQPELLFSGEGMKTVYNGAEHTWAVNYLQLALMLQAYPVSQLYVEAGPQASLLISAREKTTGASGHPNVEANFSTAQFGIGVGLGIKASDQVIVYGRYNFGLTDITTHDPTIRHSNVAQFGVAVQFYK